MEDKSEPQSSSSEEMVVFPTHPAHREHIGRRHQGMTHFKRVFKRFAFLLIILLGIAYLYTKFLNLDRKPNPYNEPKDVDRELELKKGRSTWLPHH